MKPLNRPITLEQFNGYYRFFLMGAELKNRLEFGVNNEPDNREDFGGAAACGGLLAFVALCKISLCLQLLTGIGKTQQLAPVDLENLYAPVRSRPAPPIFAKRVHPSPSTLYAKQSAGRSLP